MIKMLAFTLLTLASSCIASALHRQDIKAQAQAALNLTVLTSNGRITGHTAPSKPDVIEFLGIPYASPPVGDLRFAATVPYVGNTPQNASTFVRLPLDRESALNHSCADSGGVEPALPADAVETGQLSRRHSSGATSHCQLRCAG